MRRRDFLKSSLAAAGALQIGSGTTRAMVRAHNWGKCDFGSVPTVKGMKYPVRWACHQQLNEDGSLSLRRNLRQD